MKKFQAATLATLILMSFAASVATAQPQRADESSNAVTAASQPNPASVTQAQKKAARKAARKEARARRTAELKKLESAGYKPGGYDPNYPESAQGAEKKVGIVRKQP
jgi:opacity protein-like surface antigen